MKPSMPSCRLPSRCSAWRAQPLRLKVRCVAPRTSQSPTQRRLECTSTTKGEHQIATFEQQPPLVPHTQRQVHDQPEGKRVAGTT